MKTSLIKLVIINTTVSLTFILSGCNKVDRVEVNPPNPPEEISNNNVITKITPPPSTTTETIKESKTSNDSNNKKDSNKSEEKENKVKSLPENIYVLIKYKSIELNDGIKGFPVGTILTKVGENKYSTKDSTESSETIVLAESEVTNDFETATRYISSDKINQASIIKRNAPVSTPVPAPTQTPPSNTNTNTTNNTNIGSSLNKNSYNRRGKDGLYSDEQGRKYRIEDGIRVYIK